jgi:long-chain fatty acid transport protein
VVSLVAGAAHASGFLLVEQSANALGRAGAMTAAPAEPAAVWFNPAALARSASPAASATAALLRHQTRFSPGPTGTGAPPSDVSSLPDTNVLPSLFASTPLPGPFAAGLGLYAPFGLAVDWPKGWLGETHSLATRIWTIAANPVLAVRLPGRLAIGGGVSLLRGGVRLETALPAEVGGTAELTGGAWGLGWNAALEWQALAERLHVGATFRRRTRLAFTGTADFTPLYAGTAQIPAAVFMDGAASAEVTLPDVFSLGVMGRPHPHLELSADVQLATWHTFDRLIVDFEYGGTPDTILERRSRDPWTFRVGGEWAWPERSLALRAGALYDQSASPGDTLSPATPDAHRIGVSLGVGYPVRPLRMHVDIGYMYLRFLPARASGCAKAADGLPDPLSGSRCPPEGTYRTGVHALALTVIWR